MAYPGELLWKVTVKRALLYVATNCQLENPVRCIGNVEVWLGELLEQQTKALHTIIRLASQFINDQEFQLLAFINESIAQVPQRHVVRLRNVSV